jgi:K(+)-stimulated pyrophosphate-energized sodium pump
MLPYLFSALTMTAVGKAAYGIVLEVRRQFRDIPGLLAGTAQPDYKQAVDIATQSALRQMVLPGLLAVIAPLLVGMILGAEALAGMLVGATASGFLLAVMMANAGGAWDNAKKWIETGEMGGKGSEAHKAAVVGDTVGDPFKDTAGPSLNILIKLMSIVSLVFAGLFGEGWLRF